MRAAPGRVRRRAPILVVLAALPLILCAQSLQGMLESAPDDRSDAHLAELGVDSLADRPTGDLAGFPGPAFNHGQSVLPTGEGDLSQLWFHDGRWWGVLIDAATNEFHIWALDPARRAWVDTGTYVDDRPFVRPDVLWAGNHLYVIAGGRRSYRSFAPRLTRFSYDAVNRRWVVDPDFPAVLTPRGVGDPMIARDSTGTLWMAYRRKNQLMVAHSQGTDSLWSDPVPVPGPASSRKVVAFSLLSRGDSISVAWIAARDARVRITSHVGPANAGQWSTIGHNVYGLDGTSQLSARVGRHGPVGPLLHHRDHQARQAREQQVRRAGRPAADGPERPDHDVGGR